MSVWRLFHAIWLSCESQRYGTRFRIRCDYIECIRYILQWCPLYKEIHDRFQEHKPRVQDLCIYETQKPISRTICHRNSISMEVHSAPVHFLQQWSLWICAHATISVLSCHVKMLIPSNIYILKQFIIEFELQWKNFREMIVTQPADVLEYTWLY